MKKYRVYLSPASLGAAAELRRREGLRAARGRTATNSQYRVIKTINTLTVSVGQLLTEKEVSELMRRPSFEVTIQLGRDLLA